MRKSKSKAEENLAKARSRESLESAANYHRGALSRMLADPSYSDGTRKIIEQGGARYIKELEARAKAI